MFFNKLQNLRSPHTVQFIIQYILNKNTRNSLICLINILLSGTVRRNFSQVRSVLLTITTTPQDTTALLLLLQIVRDDSEYEYEYPQRQQ